MADHTHPSAFPYGPYPTFPLTTESWHIREGGGKAHTAVFEVEEPVHSDSGFQFTISHEDRDADRWGYQNLGRFRWSVGADRRDRPVAQWLADLVDQADRDDWRRSMRSEIRRGDIAALIQRAADAQAIEDQPEIILIQLARALRETEDVVLFGMLTDTINWEVLKPIAMRSEGGATLDNRTNPPGSRELLLRTWQISAVRYPRPNLPARSQACRVEVVAAHTPATTGQLLGEPCTG